MRKRTNTYNNFWRVAKRFSFYVKKKEQIDAKSIESSWKEIENQLFTQDLRRQSNTHKNRIIACSIAATLFILLLVSYPFIMSENTSSLTLSLLDNAIYPDSLHRISLVTSNSRMELEDKSILGYDTDGSLIVNLKQITKTGVTEKHPENELNHIIVPHGKHMQITFSDGTKMYVNSSTHVVYPTVFNKDKREIVVEGEVYLEVAHNTAWPFIVKTGQCNVKVLGTAFNISAYKNTKEASVVLVRGKVQVETTRQDQVTLQPDEMAHVSSSGIRTQYVDVLKYTCWKDYIMLLNDKAGVILDQLSAYYGVKIVYNRQISEIPLSGKLDLRGDIEEVINIIGESVSLDYKKSGEREFHLSIKE